MPHADDERRERGKTKVNHSIFCQVLQTLDLYLTGEGGKEPVRTRVLVAGTCGQASRNAGSGRRWQRRRRETQPGSSFRRWRLGFESVTMGGRGGYCCELLLLATPLLTLSASLAKIPSTRTLRLLPAIFETKSSAHQLAY